MKPIASQIYHVPKLLITPKNNSFGPWWRDATLTRKKC